MLGFLGIGAQKAGTSWLYEVLRTHPDIAFPAGKEVHYWNGVSAWQPLEWYASLFSRDQRRIQGDITPAYATLERDTIQRVYDFAPTLRIIYILRNPIRRAWSTALMAMERADLHPEEVSDQWFLDHFHSRGSRARGAYKRCLENWLSVFPRPQIFVARYDWIANDPAAFIKECLRHIGVNAENEFEPALLHGKVFSGPGMELRPSLAGALHDIYDGEINELANFLSWDLDDWLADARSNSGVAVKQ